MLSEARNNELSSQEPSQVVVRASKCRYMETAEDVKPFEDSYRCLAVRPVYSVVPWPKQGTDAG